MNFHQGTAGAPPCRHARAALLRAFVPDIGEKLGFRSARERKSVSRRGRSAAATTGGDDGVVGVVRGERRLLAERRAGVSILISEICLKREARRRGKYIVCCSPLQSNFIQSTIALRNLTDRAKLARAHAFATTSPRMRNNRGEEDY